MANDLVFLHNSASGVVFNYKEGKQMGKEFKIANEITTVAYHSSHRLAIGDNTGRITLFSNILSKKGRISSTLHWHSMAVGSLRFMDSRTLLSGGKEAVLVFWHEASNQKDFCPRLHSKINGIFLDSVNEKIALRYENNCIGVVRASNYKTISLVKSIDLRRSEET